MPKDVSAVSKAKAFLNTANDGIRTVYNVLKSYDKLHERILPWKDFNQTLIKMDKYRQNFSIESAELIGEIKVLMLKGKDCYLAASKNVYEWAGLVTPLLTAYISLLRFSTPENTQTQKDILLSVLDEGIHKFERAQDELFRSSGSFNRAAGRLVALHARFESEFNEESEYVQSKISQIRILSYVGGAYILGLPGILVAHLLAKNKFTRQLMLRLKSIELFYDKLKGRVDQAAKDIDKAKRILSHEVQQIGEMKVETQEITTFVHLDHEVYLREVVTESAEKLIAKCQEYRERHIEKINKYMNIEEKKKTKTKKKYKKNHSSEESQEKTSKSTRKKGM